MGGHKGYDDAVETEMLDPILQLPGPAGFDAAVYCSRFSGMRRSGERRRSTRSYSSELIAASCVYQTSSIVLLFNKLTRLEQVYASSFVRVCRYRVYLFKLQHIY